MTWLAAIALPLFGQSDAKVTELKDGYVRVETSSYSIELPKDWKVGKETPWGARKLSPGAGAGEMGTMTAGPTTQSWDDLYRTSLYFIQREEKGKPQPYTLSKTTQGYEACSFSVLSEDGSARRRYVLLKSKEGRVLALSIRIPDKQAESTLSKHFDRLVKTAKIN